MLESGAGADIENMFGDIVFLENRGRCEQHTSDVERDVSIAYEGEVGNLVKGGCGWVGGMLGVPVHEGECGNAMRGRGHGWVECRKGASGCKQEVCVVLEEGGEGEGERVRDRGGRRAADVDVAKEAETRVSSGLVELVRAVLGRREQTQTEKTPWTHLDLWVVRRNTIADEAVRRPETVEYVHPQRRRRRASVGHERQQPRGHVEGGGPTADDGELDEWWHGQPDLATSTHAGDTQRRRTQTYVLDAFPPQVHAHSARSIHQSPHMPLAIRR